MPIFNYIIFSVVFLLSASNSITADAEVDYITKLLETNKKYRHQISEEILDEKNYVVITSFLRVSAEENNKGFEYKEVLGYPPRRYNKMRIFKKHKLSAKDSRNIISKFSNTLKKNPVDTSTGDIATYQISVYNQYDGLLIETDLNAFPLMNVGYPLAMYVDRIPSGTLFLEAQKLIPLNKEQLEYIAKWLPEKYFDSLMEKIKNFK